MTKERLQQICESLLYMLEDIYSPEKEDLITDIRYWCNITKQELHELNCGDEYDEIFDELEREDKDAVEVDRETRQDDDIEYLKDTVEKIQNQLNKIVEILMKSGY